MPSEIPQEFINYIYTHATKNNVDPAIMAAMAFAESTFNPNAVSRRNAQGLYQIVPSTFRQFADEGDDPFDPESSTKVAARYLAYLLKRYKGDYERALAAYNWGPSNVNRLIRIHGRRRWVEHLPRETRNYLKKVLGNKDSYTSYFQNIESSENNLELDGIEIIRDNNSPQESSDILNRDSSNQGPSQNQTQRPRGLLPERDNDEENTSELSLSESTLEFLKSIFNTVKGGEQP